jgi:hypothetical protein
MLNFKFFRLSSESEDKFDIINLIILIMKKLLFTLFALGGIIFPLSAQVDHDFNINDIVPVVSTTITKDKVPAAVVNEAVKNFDINNQVTWSKFPYALKEYGWVYDVGASDIVLDRYLVQLKTKEGHDLWAIYSANGDLVESREIASNVSVPDNVKTKLANSQYKDWKIVGDKEIIKFYHDHNINSVEQHFRVTLEKGNVKRSVSFNFQGKTDK